MEETIQACEDPKEEMNTPVKENVRSKKHQGKNHLEDLGHYKKDQIYE